MNSFFVGNPRSGNPFREDYQLPPLVVVGYDFVSDIKSERTPARKVGQHRATVRALWTIPVVRGWEIPELPILKLADADNRLNVDLVADFEGIYDIEQSHFSPKLKADIDFYLGKVGERPPALGKRGSFSLSFVNGESAPTFENVKEFLAGFKYQF